MNSRYVSIWFPHLSIDWFELRQPELRKIAFVLVTPDHGRKIITAANALAIKNDITVGTVLADARAIYPALQYFDDKSELVPRLLKRIAGWCIRFTPRATVDVPSGIVLDASGCTHLWGGDHEYVTDILTRLEKKGYHAKAAIADTIGAAWAIAHFGGASAIIHTGCQLNALLPLPPAPLVGLPIGHLESPRLAIGPDPARRRQRVVIVAVEDQHHPLVAVGVGRQRRIVDQEPDIGPIRVPLLDREDDGLVLRVAGAPGGVRQERIVAVGP